MILQNKQSDIRQTTSPQTTPGPQRKIQPFRWGHCLVCRSSGRPPGDRDSRNALQVSLQSDRSERGRARDQLSDRRLLAEAELEHQQSLRLQALRRLTEETPDD